MNKCLFTKIYKTIGLSSVVFTFIVILFCSVVVNQCFVRTELQDMREKLDDTIHRYDIGTNQMGERVKVALGNGTIVKGYDSSGKSIFRYYSLNDPKYSIDYDNVDRAISKYAQDVLKGNFIKEILKIDGIKGDCIVVGESIIQEGEVVGAIIAIKPKSELNKILINFYILLVVSLLLILISTIVPVYLVTIRILTPLREMKNITMSMSKGDFSKKISETKTEDDELGELIRAFNYLSDKLRQNDENVKLLEKMKRDYVANISHELKTPITSIRAVAELLNDDMVDELERKRYYSMILRESVRLQALIKDMLELSRLQNCDEMMEKESFYIGDVIKEVSDKFETLAEDLDINFIISPEEVSNIKVFTNYNRIIQVLVILLDNAFKFTDEEGTVSISIEKEDEFIKVIVSDTGVGIDKEDLPFVFDRFYKVDKSRKSEGTGIGLSIASEIMSRLNENIYVESEMGKGSRFIFTLH